MRIAQVSATFPPYQGGTGNVCYHNSQELVKRGHEVHVYTAAYMDTPYEENFHRVKVHRLKPLFQFGNAPFIPGMLNLKGFDIIHLHYPFIFGAEMVWLISKLRGIPYVLTHHNDLIGTGLRQYLFEIYSALWTRAVFNGAAKFAAVSKDHAAHCRLTPLFKKRWGDVVEVPNGVDINLFRPGFNGLEIRIKAHIPQDAKVILFVGALDKAHSFKGVEVLIQAFAQINDPQSCLMIVGDGDLRNHYESLAGAAGISTRVYFIGKVPNEDLPPYMAAADLLVLPSTPPESFGMVLIEAMACGLPVIAHDIPGVRSVVADGADGYLVEPGNTADLSQKINKMLSLTVKERQAMGIRGHMKVNREYSWESVGEKLEMLYQQLLQVNSWGGQP